MSVQGKASSLSERKCVGRKGFLPCFISFLHATLCPGKFQTFHGLVHLEGENSVPS